MRHKYTRYPGICRHCGKAFASGKPKQPHCGRSCGSLDRLRAPEDLRFARWAKAGCGSFGCTEWTGAINDSGYGLFGRRQEDGTLRLQLAHRAAYEMAYNCCILPEFEVMHVVCDNPPCVRVDHLALGTHLDNRLDCVRKGRQSRGETSGKAKLTEAIVIDARERHAKGETFTAIARDYGVTLACIRHAVVGLTWRHVE